MKKLSLILGLIACCITIGKAQNITYGYFTYDKSEEDTLNTKYASKVYVSIDKYRASSFRLYENWYEKIYYTRKTVEQAERAAYVISNKNILYLGAYKVPKWYSLRKYEKYYVSPEGLHSISPKGNVGTVPCYKHSSDDRIYSAWNFNVMSNKYYYGNKRWFWGLETYGKEYGGVGLFEFIEDRYIELSKHYSPEYTMLLQTSYAPIQYYEKRINNALVKMKNDTTTISLLAMLTTVIHESIHQKQYELTTDSTIGYYINSNKTIIVKTDSIVYTEYVYDIIPDSVHLNFSVINTYMLGERMSSNLSGIYGILDEFSAYYHGYNSTLKLINQLTNSADSNEIKWRNNSLEELQNNIYKYYTFNLIIAWYLDYAKQNYNSIYEKFMNNKELREAYSLIDKGFNQVIQQYDSSLNSGLFSKEYEYREYAIVKNTMAEYEKNKKMLDEFKVDL